MKKKFKATPDSVKKTPEYKSGFIDGHTAGIFDLANSKPQEFQEPDDSQFENDNYKTGYITGYAYAYYFSKLMED